jgi:hypothetical protein
MNITYTTKEMYNYINKVSKVIFVIKITNLNEIIKMNDKCKIYRNREREKKTTYMRIYNNVH